MKRLFLTSSLLFSSFLIYAQNKNVGIGTETPTEVLDVIETMRVRNLPNDGASYTDGTGVTKTFTALTPIVNSATQNVVGKTNKADLVPNNTTTGFDTTDNSKAMFVIKRFAVGDWPSQPGNVGIDTGMSSTKWEAVMSNVGFTFTTIQAIQNVFNELHLHSWTLFDNNTTWRITGDINGVNEKSDYVDILFIRKSNIATDSRAASFPF